jgi:periplasmic glucans biosynthesis protein
MEATLNRRSFLQAAASITIAAPAGRGLISPAKAEAVPFDRSFVRKLARDAANTPYKAPDTKLPDTLKKLDYDHYRQIRFLPERALWRDEKLPFQVQFFHRGFFYEPRVDIYEVVNGQASRISYRP